MYFAQGGLTFDRIVAFVTGLDLGTDGRLLDGFREYLILRLGEESSLWWPSLAIKTRYPDAPSRPTTPEEERAAVDVILDLLDEFLAEFPLERSRGRLHQEYILWQQQSSFFNLDAERFGRSPRPDTVSVDEAIDILGVTRTALFDLVAAGKLSLFRSGAALLLDCGRVIELRDQGTDSP